MRAIGSPAGWPWARAAALFAVVTLGGSQVLFNLILRNPDHFPRDPRFHVWVVVWAQILPWLALFALDAGIRRGAGEDSRGNRLWRSSLYGLTAALFLRQVRVHYLSGALPPFAEATAYLAAGAAVGWLSFRRGLGADRYFAALGLLAAILTAQYAGGTWLRSDRAARAGEAAPAPGAPPVVLIVFDELCLDVLLKDGAVDRERFPRLAELADESAWFPNAASTSPFTEPSVATMLTGRWSPGENEPLVFERLRDSHRSTGLLAWPYLCRWLNSRAKSGDRFVSRTDADALRMGPWETAEFLAAALSESSFFGQPLGAPSLESFKTPDLWDIWTSRDVLGVEVSSFLGLLKNEAGAGRLLYWHCSLPHSPFQYDAEGCRHGKGHDRFSRGADAQAVWRNYREQARGVDRVIGRVVDGLKAEGLYDRTILIVTSDHGLRSGGALEPEGYPKARSGLEVRIPFLVRGPSIRPGVRAAEYQHVDFVPTLLDLLGRPAEPGSCDGVSAFATERPSRDARFFHAGGEYVRDRSSGLWRLKKE